MYNFNACMYERVNVFLILIEEFWLFVYAVSGILWKFLVQFINRTFL